MNDTYREAIENTARELKVDPLALAEAARDGKWLAFAIEFTEQCFRGDLDSIAGLSKPEADWWNVIAALRASKPEDKP